MNEKALSFRAKHSFMIFIIGSIVIACNLVGIAIAMYNSSGAAQLDLSRPGYVSVRSQANTTESSLKSFSSSGSIDQEIIDGFQELYDTQSAKVESVDAFSGDPLNPKALGISG